MMMNRTLALLLLSTMIVACERVDTRTTDNDSSAMASVAGDKQRIADLLRSAHDRGTLDNGIEIAMRDSAVAAEIIAVVSRDPRFAQAVPTESSPKSLVGSTTTGAQKKTVVTRRASVGSTSANSGDVLDKAERTGQKVNEKNDQAARIKQQADEARKKIGVIIGK
jgi:hypothetical protein